MFFSVCVGVCMCMWVCVCERDRESHREHVKMKLESFPFPQGSLTQQWLRTNRIGSWVRKTEADHGSGHTESQAILSLPALSPFPAHVHPDKCECIYFVICLACLWSSFTDWLFNVSVLFVQRTCWSPCIVCPSLLLGRPPSFDWCFPPFADYDRSEEHTSELQSR